MTENARLRTRSTFYWAMRLMPAERRLAMYAIYDLARALDDIADGAGTVAEKRAALDFWRGEIDALYAGKPTHELSRALLPVVTRFALPRAEFHELIAGLGMDVDGPIKAPVLAQLDLYCRRVAGAVGLLSLPVFGADGASEQEFALHLGRALQLTNILRDLGADATLGRLYVPREYLTGPESDAQSMLRHPGFVAATARLVADATDAFARAEATLPRCDRRPLWPALAMMAAYQALLGQLVRAGLPSGQPVRLSRWTALRVALPAAIRARF